MRQNQRRRFITGLVLIGTVIALSAFVFFLADLRAAFEHRYHLVIVYASAPRLRIGSPVWVGGHEIGRVTKIALLPVRADSTPRLAVTAEIPRKYQPLIRDDSRARLTSARIVGEPVVDITPGTRLGSILVDGDTLYGASKVDLMMAFAIWRDFQSSLDTLVRTARILRPRIAAQRPQLARLATSIQSTRNQFAEIMRSVDGGSIKALVSEGELQPAIAHLGETAGQLGPALRQASARYNNPELRAAISRLSNRADSLSVRLDTLSRKFASASLPRFVRDSAIQIALRATQIELDSLMAETKRNPLRFWLGNRK